MKKNIPIWPFLLLLFVIIIINSCKKGDNPIPAAVLTTTEVSDIKRTTATCGGDITSDGGVTITIRGVCWGVGTSPTIKDNITIDGAGAGSFKSLITGLIPGKKYFVRAYATNNSGTYYGMTMSFTTQIPQVPVLTTSIISDITETSATCGGDITDGGDAAIIARGVCWDTSTNPTIALATKTTNGTGIGTFIGSITGLTINTTYFACAYATNSAGTSYGNIVSFTTFPGLPTVQVPTGTFIMGSPTDEVNRQSDETQHQVTLNAFRMTQYEITNTQYAAFLNSKNIGSNGLYEAGVFPTKALIYASSSIYDWGLHYTGSQWIPVTGYENHPVIKVTWFGATEFATYAGGRLPTEAEWEYTCRANTTTPFNTGACLTNAQANYNWKYPYSFCTNANTSNSSSTQEVGTYLANAYGLYDMHGNVWDWCSDWYGNYSTTPQTNPTGATSGSDRVIRGGGWDTGAQSCRSAYRNHYPVDGNGYYFIGFRVVFNP